MTQSSPRSPQVNSSATEQELRSEVFAAVQRYHDFKFKGREFSPGQTYVPVSGKVFDEQELLKLVDSSLDFWLTIGRYAAEFERRFAEWMGIKHCLLVNSGSSANLLALTALTSPQLGDRRLKPGDEVITVAAGFPTTVCPVGVGVYRVVSSTLPKSFNAGLFGC